MKGLIVEYLRLRAAEIGGVDEHLGLTEKREGGDVSAPHLYVGGGDVRPVNIDSGSIAWFSTYQKEEFVTVDGMKAAKDIQGTFYIRYAAILHRDTRDHNEYAEDIANTFTGISSDLKQILKARRVDIVRSSIETDITRAWREEFTTPLTDINYRLGMVLVDVTVNVVGSRDCWQGCSESADILQGFDWCDPSTFQRLTEAQQQCVADQIPCEDANYQLFDTDGNLLSTGSIPSGSTEPITAPDGTVMRDGIPYGSVLSGGSINVLSNCPAPPYPPEWQPNPNWPNFPTTLIPTDEIFYGIFPVYENGYNVLAVSRDTGNDFTVDPGDGSTPFNTVAGNNLYQYDYATVPSTAVAETVDGELTGRMVKYVIVTFTPITTITRINLRLLNAYEQPWVDIYASLPNLTNLDMGTSVTTYTRWSNLERLRLISSSASLAFSGFQMCSALRVVDVPWSVITPGTGFLWMNNIGPVDEMPDIVVAGGAVSNSSFENSQVRVYNDIDLSNCTLVGAVLLRNAKFRAIGTVTYPAASTNPQNNFERTVNCRTPIRLSGAAFTNLLSTFRYTSAPQVIVDDASAVTNTSNVVGNANIPDGAIFNGLTVGFSLNGTNCTSQGGFNTMDALGTASGSQTIDCRNTPFAADYAAGVPLALSAHALGVSKGFSLTMS